MQITYEAIIERAEDTAKDYMPDLPKLPERQLYADSARGVYIPQHFAESVDRSKCDTPDDDLDQLAQGPDSCELYWGIWADVLDSCVLTDDNGQQWRLHHDGDLWLIPVNAIEAWESFQSELKDLDSVEIAHESSEWDWVIYYHHAMNVCRVVPGDVLDQAESEWHDMCGPDAIDDSFGLYELAGQLAAIIVTREIIDAVEREKDSLYELAENQLENL